VGGGGAEDLPSPHVPMSMLCLPGTIGGGGMPAFFFIPWEDESGGTGFAGWLATLAQVIFLGSFGSGLLICCATACCGC